MTDHIARQAGLLEAFDTAYAKAAESSQPDDWMQAALLARQWRNAVLTAPAAPAPNDSPCKIPAKAILARVNAGEALLSRVTVEELKFLAGEGCDCSGSDKDATPAPAAQALERSYDMALEKLVMARQFMPADKQDAFDQAWDKRRSELRATRQQSAPTAECTCPSGNGSLRYPCPAHSADAASEAIYLAKLRNGTTTWLEFTTEAWAKLDSTWIRCKADAASEADKRDAARWRELKLHTHETELKRGCTASEYGQANWLLNYATMDDLLDLYIERRRCSTIDAALQRERQQGAQSNG